jgi:glycerophosphoryl diester phosphodiesterase
MRRLFPIGAPGRPVFVAHRGASDRALENSPSAFALALADGADMIEFDVRLTGDGSPVVFHDARTGRTATENVAVARTSAESLSRVRLKNGEPVPSLAQVLEMLRSAAAVNVESKVAGGIAAVARLLDGTGYPAPLMLSSGMREECLAARTVFPAIPCGLVTRRPTASDLAFCARYGLSSIHPDRRFLTVMRLRALRASGIPVVPYTVDDPVEAFRLIAEGAAGVFSNRAQALREEWRRLHPDA